MTTYFSLSRELFLTLIVKNTGGTALVWATASSSSAKSTARILQGCWDSSETAGVSPRKIKMMHFSEIQTKMWSQSDFEKGSFIRLKLIFYPSILWCILGYFLTCLFPSSPRIASKQSAYSIIHQQPRREEGIRHFYQLHLQSSHESKSSTVVLLSSPWLLNLEL